MWEEDKIGFMIMCVIIVAMTVIIFIYDGDVEKRKCTYTTPAYIPCHNADQFRRYEEIRDMAIRLAMVVEKNCPDSKDKFIALTNIEKAVYSANVAIVRNE